MRLLFVFCFFLTYVFTCAQKPGTWLPHYSYRIIHDLADAPDRIYAAASNAVFYYDKVNKNTVRLSKADRLSDVGVGAIAYDSVTNSFVVGYKNGNVDVLRDNQTFNAPYLMQNKILPNKQIADIHIHDTKAYISTYVGIVVFDLNTLEFTETYFIGENGGFLKVSQVSINENDDLIYAATADGLMYAPFSQVNLADFNNWKFQQKDDNSLVTSEVESVVSVGNHTLFAVENVDTTYSLYTISNGEKATLFKKQPNDFNSLDVYHGRVHVSCRREVFVYDENLYLKHAFDYLESNRYTVKKSLFDKDGDLWVSDHDQGIANATAGFSVLPDGPYNDFVSDIDYDSDGKVLASFGRAGVYTNGGFGQYNTVWDSRILWESTASLCILKDPNTTEGFYVGSYVDGMHHYSNSYTLKYHYNASNSLLEDAWEGASQVTDLALDDNNVVWVANTVSSYAVKAIDARGEWYRFKYPNQNEKAYSKEILVDQYNNKWVVDGNEHLAFVFNENETLADTKDDKFTFVEFKNGTESYVNSVFSLAEDHDGIIWAGTDNGIATYSNDNNVFAESSINFQRIKVEVDSIIDYVLEGIAVQSIAVDAGNRKWIGTQNNGVYLLSDDGTEFIRNFTKNNSPLPSNNVHLISIRPSDGNVFFGTENGLVSYLGDAGPVVETMEEFKVIPNPVRETYSGMIYIHGFVDNALVRITDLDGNLVYETFSNGGTASWNGLNLLGNRPKTGVYLIFASSEDGSDAQVGKLMFIN